MRGGPGRFLALAMAVDLVVPAAFGQPPASTADTVTLRLRDAPLVDVVYVLFRMTSQGFVVDGDVLGRVDVELVDVSPLAIEQSLEQLGLSISGVGSIRRVATGSESAALRLSGVGDPMSLGVRRPGDLRDFLRLFEDVTGEVIVAPEGSLGRVSIFGDEVATEDMFRAVLASARLDFRREDGRLVVWRRSEPGALSLPVSISERHYGHVPYREGGAGARPAGLQGLLAEELTLSGVWRRGSTWTAMVNGQGRPYELGIGYPLLDAKVESVAADGVVLLREDRKQIELRLRPAAPGLATMAENAEQAMDRAWVRRDAGEFDAAEGILRTAMEAGDSLDRDALRAALSDLHYAWGQSLLSRHVVLDAIPHFESAYEIDTRARPWQAGEDLNEIGFAWTEIGEPERAVACHQQALEIARTVDVSKEPRTFTCVRTHPRSAWIEPSALDGLANAERVRGHLADSRDLYAKAIPLWRKLDDPFGESAALTGLGLVEQGLGHYERALALQQEALAKPLDRHPWARAVVLNNLGSAQLALGHVDDAHASFASALRDYQFLRDRGGEGTALDNLGVLAESRALPGEACASYVQALEASRQADDRSGQVTTLGHMARLVARSRPDDAGLARCRQVLAASH